MKISEATNLLHEQVWYYGKPYKLKEIVIWKDRNGATKASGLLSYLSGGSVVRALLSEVYSKQQTEGEENES